VSQDFRPSVFFHQTIPPRALIQGLKPFRIWLRICREKRDKSFEKFRFRVINDTAGSDLDSVVSMRQRMRIQRWHWPHGIKSHGVNDTAGSFHLQAKDYKLPFPLKGNHSKKIYISKQHTHEVTRNVNIKNITLTKKGWKPWHRNRIKKKQLIADYRCLLAFS
jgi:hypothetical protein